MKKFLKLLKRNLMKITITALPLVGIAIFLPLLLTCVIDTSVFLASIFSVFAVLFAIITIWQSQRQNEQGLYYKRTLTQVQINQKTYESTKASLLKAVTALDLQKLRYIASNCNNIPADKLLEELYILSSNILSSQMELLINTHYNIALEKDDCFLCDKPDAKDFKFYAKAVSYKFFGLLQ